jgi:hypothetical protein
MGRQMFDSPIYMVVGIFHNALQINGWEFCRRPWDICAALFFFTGVYSPIYYFVLTAFLVSIVFTMAIWGLGC